MSLASQNPREAVQVRQKQTKARPLRISAMEALPQRKWEGLASAQ